MISKRPLTFDRIEEARAFALSKSQKNPERYYWISDCWQMYGWTTCEFAWLVAERDLLDGTASSNGTHFSGLTGTYWKGGKEFSLDKSANL